MTDLEITRLCAEAMGIKHWINNDALPPCVVGGGYDPYIYDPLHDDAQAMALIKRFQIQSAPLIDGTTHEGWVAEAHVPFNRWTPKCQSEEGLNRAICECVAKMQFAKDKK